MLSKTDSEPLMMQYTDHPAAAADDDFEEGQSRAATPRQRPRPSRQVASHVVVFIATSLLWAFVLFVTRAGTPSPSSSSSSSSPAAAAAAETTTTTPKPAAAAAATTTGSDRSITEGATLRTCGNSTAEARALDCRYDLLLNSWVPAACYDGEFEAEYLDDGSGGAFADEALTLPLPDRAAIEAMPVYYTSRRDHANHCAVFWRKQFDVLVSRPLRAFDTMVINDYHADHCSQYLVDAAEGNLTGSTRVVAGFGGCWVRD